MKKSIKITLIVLIVLIGIIILDTLQAKIFNNSPLIKVTENYNGIDVIKRDKGIFTFTYIFPDETKKTVFRWKKYAPPKVSSSTDKPISVERKKLSEENLKSDESDVTMLVKFNNILYGKSYAIIDYAGDLNKYIGTIDLLIDEAYIPALNGETNRQEFLNTKILQADENQLVINYNNEAILFNSIIEN